MGIVVWYFCNPFRKFTTFLAFTLSSSDYLYNVSLPNYILSLYLLAALSQSL